MKIGTIFAAGAIAAAGVALTPAPAEARTYVSIGLGSPGYYGGGYYGGGYYGRQYRGGYYGRGYHGRDRYYGRPYYGRNYYGRGHYDRGYYGYDRPRRVVCRYDRWGQERCRRH